MISVIPHETQLNDRINVIKSLISETHPPLRTPSPISREARGIAILLLFAAYENLLRTLTRTLLESAKLMRVSNKKLQPGFRMFEVSHLVESIRDSKETKLYKKSLRDFMKAVDSNNYLNSSINVLDFPDDGSFMKSSQIELWSEIFNIGDPKQILHRTWTSIDSVVSGRNQIAHGSSTPEEIGRSYTQKEIEDLISNWHADWLDFLHHVEHKATNRSFFRIP